MKKLRWTSFAIDAYKQAGVEMKEYGFRAMREVKDPDCGTVLTFWGGATGTVIQQTWVDTGDVVFYRAVHDAKEATAAEVLA